MLRLDIWYKLYLICFMISCGSLLAEVPLSPLNLSKTSPIRPMAQKFFPQHATLINPPLLVQNFLIVIDPGHGGHDTGTQSISKPRYQEKSLNLVTAQFVKGFLQQLGYQVFMTREDDTFISLDKRAQLANEKKPTLFVSIHYNSAPNAEAQGVEVFFYQSKDKKERTLKSKRLAQAILKNVLVHTQAKSRGVKQANYAVIRETNMPAVLVEGGFVTNEAELQNLKDPTYLKKLAWGIVRGIEEYTSKLHHPSQSGAVQN
jgi:N-acetylmuramoyl-L-alanine amidase